MNESSIVTQETESKELSKRESVTRERLLDVAEYCFAETGFEGTPLRKITNLASANTAAVNYHFGSKRGLLKAVFLRKAAPINAEIQKRFDKCDQQFELGKLNVEDVLRAFMEPMLDCHHLGETGQAFRKLLGRIAMNAGHENLPIIRETFAEVADRFIEILRTVSPGMSNEEYFWRLACIYGAVLYILADEGWLEDRFNGRFNLADDNGAKSFAIPMLVKGMEAMAANKKPGSDETQDDACKH